MIETIEDLLKELKITVVSSKKSGVICNINEMVNETSEIYETLRCDKSNELVILIIEKN